MISTVFSFQINKTFDRGVKIYELLICAWHLPPSSLCASILTACHWCNHNCFNKVALLLSYWAIQGGRAASPSLHKTAVNAAGQAVAVDTIYWLLSAYR